MAGPGFVNDVAHDDLVLFQKELRTNRNNIEIMAFVTIMSTRWIQFKVFNFQH